jgi:hypothetical protein
LVSGKIIFIDIHKIRSWFELELKYDKKWHRIRIQAYPIWIWIHPYWDTLLQCLHGLLLTCRQHGSRTFQGWSRFCSAPGAVRNPTSSISTCMQHVQKKRFILDHLTLDSVWLWLSNSKTGYIWPSNSWNRSQLTIRLFWFVLLTLFIDNLVIRSWNDYFFLSLHPL